MVRISCWNRITVGVVLTNHIHENLNDVMSNGVNAVIITILREVTLSDVIGNKASLIADNPYLCMPGAEEVGNNRERPALPVETNGEHAHRAVSGCAHGFVLIVRVVDYIKSVDINACKPSASYHIFGEDITS